VIRVGSVQMGYGCMADAPVSNRLALRRMSFCLEMVTPGDHMPLDVNLDKPISLETGSRIAIREGGKTVGSSVETDVIK
jgi:translation elongation factor EF-Tu-like GTPase